jgi:uncharacterized protein (DUF488 family)
MEIYTIGFTKRSADEFFTRLRSNRITRLLDVRLRNDSQLAGFARRRDLPFFLRELIGADYLPVQQLAPTKPLLDAYRRGQLDWQAYEQKFILLMSERRVEDLDKSLFGSRPVLLCSEFEPDRCHRRLVAEYLRDHWTEDAISIHHL